MWDSSVQFFLFCNKYCFCIFSPFASLHNSLETCFKLLCSLELRHSYSVIKRMLWGKFVLIDTSHLWWVSLPPVLHSGSTFFFPIFGLPGCSRKGQSQCGKAPKSGMFFFFFKIDSSVFGMTTFTVSPSELVDTPCWSVQRFNKMFSVYFLFDFSLWCRIRSLLLCRRTTEII